MKKLNSWDRRAVANNYIVGEGIEIGALHSPLKLLPQAKVRYVDRMSVPDLYRQYPELLHLDLVNPDIIDDGENLASIQDSTQDFVIANHFIEHCQNPVLAIRNMIRVLKVDGILYLVIPDKRFTFDVDRPVTALDHLLRDSEEGPDWSKHRHFEEWVRYIDKIEDKEAFESRVNELIAMNYSIHFHVWTQVEMVELMITLKNKLGLRFDMELFLKNNEECIFVLRKTE